VSRSGSVVLSSRSGSVFGDQMPTSAELLDHALKLKERLELEELGGDGVSSVSASLVMGSCHRGQRPDPQVLKLASGAQRKASTYRSGSVAGDDFLGTQSKRLTGEF
jgi:hypothetical protein